MPCTAFVGRQAQREALLGHLRGCLEGRTQAVCVTGPPGIGKSALSDWLSERAREQGVAVAWTKTWELGGAPPYWPWAQLVRGVVAALGSDFDPARLDPYRAQLGALVPEWAPAGGAAVLEHEHAQFAMFDAVARFVAELSRLRPLLLVLDDVHAADSATLRLAAFVLSNWRDVPLMFLTTARSVDARTSEEAKRPLAEFERACVSVPVGPLSAEAVGELLAQRLGRPIGAGEVEELCSRTGGNPLFVVGLADARASAGGGAQSLPSSVQTVIDQRLDALAASTHEILAALALIRHGATIAWLARTFSCTALELRARLQPACDAQIVQVDGEGELRFMHDLFAEALARRTSDALRASLAGQAASAWEALGPEHRGAYPGSAARLYFESGSEQQRRRGVEHALNAARQASEALDYAAAARLYRAAVEHMPGGPAKRSARLALARAMIRAGQPEPARALLGPLIDAAVEAGEHELVAGATLAHAQTFEYGSFAPQRIARLEAALELIPAEQAALKAPLLSEFAFAVLMGGRGTAELRAWLIDSAKAVREASVSPVNRLEANVASFIADWRPATLEARTEMVRDMEALLPSLSHEAHRLSVHRWRVNSWLEHGAGREAGMAIRDYSASAQALRAPQLLMNAALRRTIPLQLAGDFDALEPVLDELREQGQRAGDIQTDTYVALGRCLMRFEREQLDQGLEDMPIVAQCREWWGGIAGPGLFAERTGAWLDLPEARRHYQSRKRAGFPLLDYWSLVQGLAILGELSLLFEDRESYALLYERLAPYEMRYAGCGIGWPLGCAALFLGRLAAAMGRQEDALRHVERAIVGNERLQADYWVAQSRLELVDLRHDLGRVDAASRGLLRRVQADAESRGWLRTAKRAASLAERIGNPQAVGSVGSVDATREGTFRRSGELWEIGLGGQCSTFRPARGHDYLHALLQGPHVEVHVLELAYPDGAPSESDTGPVLDQAAKDAYRRRAESLRETQREAEAHNDYARAERAQAELDALADELAAAIGLGGRDRKTGSAAERARSSVTQAIRRALKSIERQSPELAAHLRKSVRTGSFCAYEPEPGAPVQWSLG